MALYQKTHPDYPSYLYLVAPISLAILNPLGFVFMELEKRREQIDELRDNQENKFKVFLVVMKSIITNPIVFMTALGIVGNFVFTHHLPLFLSGILKVSFDYRCYY